MPNQKVFPVQIFPLSRSLEKPVLGASNDFTPLPQESPEQYFIVAKLKVCENLSSFFPLQHLDSKQLVDRDEPQKTV